MSLTFRKNERLTSQIVIDEVFAKGKELKKFPFLAKYILEKESAESGIKVVISVPKRKAKLATSRNRLRRQIKEAYRLNKKQLTDYCIDSKLNLALFLIYSGKENESYQFIQEKIKLLLSELQIKLKQD